jgi:hypothetical protein
MAGRYGLPVIPKPYSIDENLYQWIQATNTTDTNTISAISTFISGLKSTGLWNKIQTIYPFVGTTTGSQTINLKEPGLYRLGLTGSFSASSAGLYPSSSTSFVDSIPGNTVHPLVNSASAHLSLLSYDLPQTSSYPAAIVGGVGATGGEISYANGKVIHTFRSGSGSFTPVHPSITSIEVLVVAGGGGGGRGDGNNYGGGGGGAGGLVYSSSFSVTPSTAYTTVVGQGGTRGIGSRTSGSNGENSQFATIVTTGGGGGGEGGNNNPGGGAGNSGGSGGGGGGRVTIPAANSGSGIIGQGKDGALGGRDGSGGGGGGGGGAFSTGSSPVSPIYATAGAPGAGITSSISGTPTVYAQGGRGGFGTGDTNESPGTANTGNGGNGTRFGVAGDGGSGVVVVSYPTIPGNGPNNGFFITETSITGSSNSEFSGGITGSGNIGFLTVSRTGSNSFVLAKNTTQTVVNIAASGSMNPDFYLGAANLAGATSSFGNANIGIAYASIGAGLTTSEVSTYYNLVSQLQTNLKRQNTLLDNYSGAAAAYSLRRIGPSGYFGPAIRVRRDSDNTLRDIGFTSDGQLDTVGLLDFVGVTGSGFVNTWYDQSGNGNNASQATSANQPLVIVSGSVVVENKKPTLRFDGTNDRLEATSSLLPTSLFTVFAVVQGVAGSFPAAGQIISKNGGSVGRTNFIGTTDNSTVARIFFNDGVANRNVTTTSPVFNLTQNLVTAQSDGLGNSQIGVNSNIEGILTGRPWTPQNIAVSIGASAGGGNEFRGIIQELVAYESYQTTSRTLVESNINTNYKIFGSATASFDPDYQAFITATGITEPTQSAALETLVSDLKSYGLWSKMKAIYPMVTDKNNRFAQSEDFSLTWNAVSSSVTVNQITAPNGTSTADLIREEAGTGDHYVYQTVDTLVSGNEYVLSVYGRFLNRPWIALQTNDGAQAWFNLQTGVTGSFTGSRATITPVSGGWYRCALFYTASSAGAKNQHIHLADANGNYNYTGAATTGSYLWGAQFENGNVLGPYRATTATGFTTGSMLDQMKFNLKSTSSFSGSYFGGWNPGYGGNKPNGMNGYMDTNLNASTQLTNGNFHLSFYSTTNSTNGTNSNEIVLNKLYASSGWVALRTNNKLPSGIASVSFGDDTTEGAGASSTTPGYMIGTETSNSIRKVFKNNTILGTNTTTSTTAISNANINLSGHVGGYSDNVASLATIGDGLTDYEAKALYWIVQKFQTTLGRQVY